MPISKGARLRYEEVEKHIREAYRKQRIREKEERILREQKRISQHDYVETEADKRARENEEYVGLLLSILKDARHVDWYKRSQKFDRNDRKGKDFFGRLASRHQNVPFAIDVKSSLTYVNHHYRGRRESVLFVPREKHGKYVEALRLLTLLLGTHKES